MVGFSPFPLGQMPHRTGVGKYHTKRMRVSAQRALADLSNNLVEAHEHEGFAYFSDPRDCTGDRSHHGRLCPAMAGGTDRQSARRLVVPRPSGGGWINHEYEARFLTLSHYAGQSTADAILFTCSAFGDEAQARSGLPVLTTPDSAVLELRRMLQADDFVSSQDGCLPNAQVQCSSRFPIQ